MNNFKTILTEESLRKPLDEVFTIERKIGKGSYGNVFKAIHKETGQTVAIKQVPFESDLQEIIKEISIMQQCDSPYIVKYYGSYFKESDLWIVMEYCGGGSVSDIMKLRSRTLNEDEIATIMQFTLRGLEYIHLKRKIHRDIKAGNILLNSNGFAKLADFGVAGQLSDTMAKRNTVIGSPYWMAPEVIQEIGYDCAADIWSVGITAIELAEGKPPYADIHPMRAIFMIPTKPPPSFRDPNNWSSEFIDFVSMCLVKNPKNRTTATDLLSHPFIKNAKSVNILRDLIAESTEAYENLMKCNAMSDFFGETASEAEGSTVTSEQTLMKYETMKNGNDENDDGTIKYNRTFDENTNTGDRTMLKSDTINSKASSSMNTMVINESLKVNSNKMFPLSGSETIQTESNTDDTMVRKPDATLVLKNEDPMANNLNIAARMKSEMKLVESGGDKLLNLNRYDIATRLRLLDIEMEKELKNLEKKYEIKRKPILDAIIIKKKASNLF